jgi:hypothetical protein
MADLNTLLAKRWKTGTFSPLIAATSEIALQLILTERKKELAFNGCSRWEDLRRLNTDPARATTLFRKIGNESFTLSPNDLKYTFPIPDIEIKLSGIIQNPR